MLLGLTGGIAAGKTTALAAFAELGCPTLSSDAVVHALYREPEVRDAVVARLGADVLGPDGAVDRRRVGARVAADPGVLRFLEALLHPLVAAETAAWQALAAAADPAPRALVQEVPLLFEADLRERFDRVVVVHAPDEVRRARVALRGDATGLEAREARQLPAAEKRRLADDVLENDGDLEALDRAVAAYVEALGT